MGDAILPNQLGEQEMTTAFPSASGAATVSAPIIPGMNVVGSDGTSAPSGDFPWEMIGLGLEEPLPPPDIMDEL